MSGVQQSQAVSFWRSPLRFLVRRAVASNYLRGAIADILPDLVQNIKISSPTLGIHGSVGLPEYQLYKTASWVYRAASIWGMMLSGLRMKVVDGENKERAHEVLDPLLDVPNPELPSSELWNRWALEMATRGHIGFEVVYKSSRPIELWPHSPDCFRVIPDERQLVYYRPAGYHVRKFQVADYKLKTDEFIHWKFHNPFDPYHGLSPLQALQYAATNDVLASAWQYYLFKNGARPDYVITTPLGLSPREREAYEEKLAERHGLSEATWNVRKPIVLDEGAKVQELSFKPQDMEWKELREITRDEIAAVYGIPDEIMGFGKNTYENLREAMALMWGLTGLFLIQFRDDRLTHFFRRRGVLQSGLFIRTVTKNIVHLRRILEPLYNQAVKLFSMGAPFADINSYLNLGFPRFAGDENSYPFGTNVSFDPEGEIIDPGVAAKTEKNSSQSERGREAEYQAMLRIIERLRHEEKNVGCRNGHAAAPVS